MPTLEQIERATLALKVWPVFVEDPLLADAVVLAVLTAAGGRESASPSRVADEPLLRGVPYTPEDVRLVAQALWDSCKRDLPKPKDPPTEACSEDAVMVLETLAKAGRLLPEDTRIEYGWDCGKAGESCVHHILDRDRAVSMSKRRGGVAVQRSLGPWVPVPEPDMSTDPDSSVGAHNEAHSAHIPAVPAEER